MSTTLWISVPEIRKKLESPLFGNRYIGVFSGNSVFNENLGYMMNSISLPTFTYNAKEQYIGGVNTTIVNLFQQGQLDITVYNTGVEYKSFYDWGELHYNQTTKCYGYMEDIYAELSIYEFDRKADVVLQHQFHKCSLYTFGGIQLTYEEASQVETFQVSLQFRSYSLKKA